MSKEVEYEADGADFKHEDTTRTISLRFKIEQNGHSMYAQTILGHQYVARIANSSGYFKDYPVKTNGSIIKISTADLVDLIPADYKLEIWESYTDTAGKKQTSIWPTPDATVSFTVHPNITDKLGEQIKQIGFQDVVDQAVKDVGMNYVFKVNTIEPDQTATVVQAAADGKNYVTFNIPRGYKGDTGATGATGPQGPQGPKGDTGSVDNAGLTNAPAFQALQSQVNNSAVGTNLLTGTSGDLQTKQLTNVYNSGPQATNGNYQIKLVKGQTYTYRAWIDNTNGPDIASVNVRFSTTTDASTNFNFGCGTPIDKGETGYSTLLITPSEDIYAWFAPVAYGSAETCSVGWKEEKLEVGSVATDWCPNPSEVLTQSDYAKIKAAIVALGGSLS